MIFLAAFSAAIAIILGAMGAHGPAHDALKAGGMLENWQTAAHYHLIHAVALVALALHRSAMGRWATVGWWVLFGGMCIFSGSLYVLAYTGLKWLGAITPIGGIALIVGWLLTALRKQS
jgi:uncharacterized membrane protein YgdD (TMEM256/DUF423 family)